MYGFPKSVCVVYFDAPSIAIVCVYVLFRSLRAGSHVFALLMLFHCVIHNKYVVG